MSLRSKKLYSLIVILLGAGAGILLLREFQNLPLEKCMEAATNFSQSQGRWGILIFSATYIVATLLLLPCALLTIAAGVMYGAWGIPIVILSATIGAAFAFLIARYLAYQKVSRLLQKRPFTRALKDAIQTEGWKFMVLLRISPLIPFNLNNYLLGTAPVTFPSYIFATVIGTVPGTLLYIYLGTLGRNIQSNSELKWALFALGIVATLALGRLAFLRTKSILATHPS